MADVAEPEISQGKVVVGERRVGVLLEGVFAQWDGLMRLVHFYQNRALCREKLMLVWVESDGFVADGQSFIKS